MCEVMHDFGSEEKNDLWSQFQEPMTITDSQYLQRFCRNLCLHERLKPNLNLLRRL